MLQAGKALKKVEHKKVEPLKVVKIMVVKVGYTKVLVLGVEVLVHLTNVSTIFRSTLYKPKPVGSCIPSLYALKINCFISSSSILSEVSI